MRLLVVEDDPMLRERLKKDLSQAGCEVRRNWRRLGKATPVVVLTARDAWHEKVDGFKAGADDYLGKPFHIEELIARLNAVIRRGHGQSGGSLDVAGLMLNEERQSVTTAAGDAVILTGVEFRLLRYFMLHPGQILSKSQLTEHVYVFDADKDSNVIEVYINRLRQKIGKGFISTRRGQGYVFGSLECCARCKRAWASAWWLAWWSCSRRSGGWLTTRCSDSPR